jgi:hypothetical protein
MAVPLAVLAALMVVGLALCARLKESSLIKGKPDR